MCKNMVSQSDSSCCFVGTTSSQFINGHVYYFIVVKLVTTLGDGCKTHNIVEKRLLFVSRTGRLALEPKGTGLEGTMRETYARQVVKDGEKSEEVNL